MDTKTLINYINWIENLHEKVSFINKIRKEIHDVSPFKNNPVDLVIREKWDIVTANDYNPNEVASPEMELLEISIMNDWYTQPIVWWKNDWIVTIVDWFHRHRVWKESKIVSKSIMWYLPIVDIRKENQWKNERIASTIRHNRARWKHKVDAMSEIVIELKNRNWKNERIARELWMDQEEVLRLLQISWLQEMFKDDDFSDSRTTDWIEEWFDWMTDDLTDDEIDWVRTVNVEDKDRIFHTYDKWECYKNGFYKSSVNWKTKKELEEEFANFFKDDLLFEEFANKVISEWKYSCEHYLTNKCLNRIAWIWQASCCYWLWIPSKFSSWWQLLDDDTKHTANNIALKAINTWMVKNQRPVVTMQEAMWGVDRQVNIY